MSSRWTAVVLAGVTLAGGRAGAEHPTLVARPQPLPGLPAYPYRPANPEVPPKPVLTGPSLPRLDVGTPDPLRPVEVYPTTTTREVTTSRTVSGRCRTEQTVTTEKVTTTAPDRGTAGDGTAATFRLLDRVMRVDHCSVSDVTVTLYPDGKFVVNFRADQNPLAADPLTPTLTTRGRAVDTGIESGGLKRNRFYLTVRGSTAGAKAAVLALPLDPFWVERGEPYRGQAEGTSEAVRRNFKLVDKVEVDFTYR